MTTQCNNIDHGDDAHDFSKSFMYSIHQMYFLVEKRLESMLSQKSSLSFSQFMVLVGFQCSSTGPVSQTAIAEQLHVTEATVSRHISTLVSLGYLSRVENKENRRKHIITITAKGRKAFEQARMIIEHELHTIFGVIKDSDRTGIMKNFTTVLSNLLTKK